MPGTCMRGASWAGWPLWLGAVLPPGVALGAVAGIAAVFVALALFLEFVNRRTVAIALAIEQGSDMHLVIDAVFELVVAAVVGIGGGQPQVQPVVPEVDEGGDDQRHAQREGGDDAEQVAPEVARIKAVSDLPVIVGFGIKTPDAARAIASVADGAVVASFATDIASSRSMRSGLSAWRCHRLIRL